MDKPAFAEPALSLPPVRRWRRWSSRDSARGTDAGAAHTDRSDNSSLLWLSSPWPPLQSAQREGDRITRWSAWPRGQILWHFPGLVPDLPLSDVLHPQSEGSLQAGAELQGVAADLDDVVDKGTHGRQGERWREEHHVAKLYEHFLVVLKRTLGTNVSGECVLFARDKERVSYLICLHAALNLSLG